jgi:hypothetical protein
VTEGHKTRRLPVLEVTLRRLANDAMRGDHKAIKFLLSMLDRYGASPETKVQLQELLAEDRQILDQYLRTPATSETKTNADPKAKEPSDDA